MKKELPPIIKIQDESNDKRYFTILPNYIANHSTGIDQALYFQMKRYAGESDNGRCFATEKTLMKKLGIGKKSFDKSLQYLLDHKWVSFTGLTPNKTRPIKTYQVNDIWKMNNDFYDKISSKRNISFKRDKFQKEGDKFQKHTKISSESNNTYIKKNHIKEEHIKNMAKQSFAESITDEERKKVQEGLSQLRGKLFK